MAVHTNVGPVGSAEGQLKLLFMDREDILDPVGKAVLGATPLAHVAPATGLPKGMTVRETVANDDGSWTVYGFCSPHNMKDIRWRILRAHTYDGTTFQDVECVNTSAPGHWYGSTEIVHNPEDGSLLCLKWSPGAPGRGHAMWAFGSRDGSDWHPLADRPVYHDHDAFSATWDRRTGQYVVFQATYQTWERKPYADNAGDRTRRVLHFRTSKDGVDWTPAGDFTLPGTHAPDESLVTPDQDDPRELEFYRLTAFPYEGRYLGMMLNYLPGPACVYGGGHGPHSGGEWWVARDFRNWRRPFRDVFAPGPASNIIMHPPITVGGMHGWVIGDQVYGVPQYGVTHVGSLSNCEFSTPLFEIPRGQLILHAALAPEGRGFQGQSYIMVDALDECGKVIPEFEKENSVIRTLDTARRLPLRWGYAHAKGTYGLHTHAGKKACLRFHLRDARVHAVTSEG